MTTKTKLKFWIKTYSGHRIDPLNPTPDAICVEDVAHALSNQCRFAGHTEEFYSVAQHSVYVMDLLRSRGFNLRVMMAGLLHDASEAYLMDMPTPIKVRMPGYREAEDRLQAVIMKALCPLDPEICEEFKHHVKAADLSMLAAEARDIHGNPKDWKTLKGVVPAEFKVRPLSPGNASALFLTRYFGLREKLGWR